MLLLTNTTHILQLVTSSTSSLDWTVSYVDIAQGPPATFVPGSDQGNVTTAMTTTITSAPAASTQRQIKQITLHNAGGSANTVTVVKDISGTEYKVFPATVLAAGESLVYQDGGGWTYFDSTGSPQTTRKAAGNTTEIQYNNAGVLAGSSNLSYNSGTNTLALAGTDPLLNLKTITTEPAAPAAGTLNVYSKSISGRVMPKWKGPAGLDTIAQPAIFQNNIVAWFPHLTSGTWIGSTFTAITAGAAVLPTTTNLYTMLRRSTFTSATGANTQNSIRSESMFYRGNATGIGGFFFFCRFGFTTWTANNRAFTGMTAGTTAVTTVNPSTLTNIAGFGIDQGGTQWQWMHNDAAGSATVVSLPAHTAVATNRAYDAFIFCKANDSVVYYRLDDISSGAPVTIIDSSVSTDLPVNTTALNAHAAIGSGSNVGAAAAVLGVNRIYVETDF
jgi:hypothetical protein